MTATSTLDRTTDYVVPLPPNPTQPVVFTGSLLGHPVVVEADRPLPVATEHLLAQLNSQWDIRRRRSDLDRISNYPNVMISVSHPTPLLLRNALAAVRLSRLAGLDPGPCRAIIDHGYGKVGADPAVAAIMARLAPATAADLLAESCRSAGVTSGAIQVGSAVRVLGDPLEAWRRQAAKDVTQAVSDPVARGSL